MILTVPLGAQEPGEFEWSWEDGDAPPAKLVDKAAGSVVDPDTYNQLLKDNLNLRRKLQDTDRGSETMREENARLKRDMNALETKIAGSAEEIARLKRVGAESADPDRMVTMESELAAAESAKAKMAQDLAVLRSRLERSEATTRAPSGSAVKPGSDLFVVLESENAELRGKLLDVESEKQKALKQLREIETKIEAKGALEDQVASAGTESAKHKQVIRNLLERVPALEKDLADTQSREREKDAELSYQQRELRALQLELNRREHRLKKVERVAVLLARTRSEVKMTGSTRQRDMHYNMGVVFATRGQFRGAEREYLRALRQDPADADTHYNLGVLYDQNLKEHRKATSHYRRYLRLRPNAPDANQVRLWIAAVETK